MAWSQFAEREVSQARSVRNTFSEKIFYDEFLMAAGTSLEPRAAGQHYYKICQDSLCCLVRLTGDPGTGGLQGMKVGVFRGLHTVAGQYFMEICLLTNIPTTANIKISMAGLVLTIILYRTF